MTRIRGEAIWEVWFRDVDVGFGDGMFHLLPSMRGMRSGNVTG